MIIGLVGLISSGKGTVGDMLVKQGYKQDSFASSLKDSAASIFNWDRELLEGSTKESRAWREEVDTWWADRLNIPGFSPRKALQLLGTEVFRENFHTDIWYLSMEARLRNNNSDIVITDTRFGNEINMVRNLGGKIVRVKRGPDPYWFALATTCPQQMSYRYPNIHASEYSWAEAGYDYLIENNKTLDDLQHDVTNLLVDLRRQSQ